MANIPVEHKSGLPWWVWLLGLLALLLVGALLLSQCGDDDDVVAVTDTYEEPIPGPAGPIDDQVATDTGTDAITSWAMLLDAQGSDNLVGRMVDLDDLVVGNVVGDSSFFAAPASADDQRVLFVLQDLREWKAGPGTGADGIYNIDSGASIDVTGQIMAFAEGTAGTSQVAGADRTRLLDQGYYINVTNVDSEELDGQQMSTE